jgi:hypothetical protein
MITRGSTKEIVMVMRRLIATQAPSTGAAVQTLLEGKSSIWSSIRELLDRLGVRLYASQPTLSRFQVRGRVVRRYQESETPYHYLGVAFAELTGAQEDLLHAVILKSQTFMSARGLA